MTERYFLLLLLVLAALLAGLLAWHEAVGLVHHIGGQLDPSRFGQ